MEGGGGRNGLKPLYGGIARVRMGSGGSEFKIWCWHECKAYPPSPPCQKIQFTMSTLKGTKKRLLNKLLANGRTGSCKGRY